MNDTYLSIEEAADRLVITPSDMRRVIMLNRLEVFYPDRKLPCLVNVYLDNIVVKVPAAPPPYSLETAYLIPEREVERLQRGLAVARAAREQMLRWVYTTATSLPFRLARTPN